MEFHTIITHLHTIFNIFTQYYYMVLSFIPGSQNHPEVPL